MKNPLSENMLRFGTKNLSESAKQQLLRLTEAPETAGGNTNLFEKLILTVPIGKPGGDYQANKVVAGKLVQFEMIMLDTAGNPLNRYFVQNKKYPPIREIKVNGFDIAQKGFITVKSQKDGVLAGTLGLLLYTTYAAMLKKGNDPFKPINDNINKTFINPTVEKVNGALERSGGVSVTFDFGKFPLNDAASERWTQSPKFVQIIGTPI